MNTVFIDNLIKEAIALLKPENNMNLYKGSNAGSRLLTVLTELADEMIIYKEGAMLCKYQYLLLWRKYTINLEGDLLITAFLVNQSNRHADFINKNTFAWKLVIDHDNQELNSILMQGMVDNHYHLGGSLPTFQCIWIEIMTNELYRKRIENFFSDEKQLLKKAASIRQYFVDFLLKRNGILIEDSMLEGFEKYYEEREFLYHIIRELIQDDSTKILLRSLFYNYLTIKEWFRELVVQCGNNIGEQTFFSTNNNKDILLKWHNNLGQIIRSSINEQIRSSCIKKLEIRIKMQKSPLALYEYIKWLDYQINYSDVRYIICFSRKKNAHSDLQYRDQSKIAEIRKQSKDLNVFLATYPSIAKQIVGIDVCSKESNYKPEVFSEIMIRRGSSINRRLKRMYHTGETYLDILSGLRAVDECICFLGLRAGDRLGHAAPVFENVDEWYNNQGNQITISKEEYLDNMAWLYCNLPQTMQKDEEGEKILEEFQHYFRDLYQNAFEFNTILEFHHKRNIKADFGNTSVFHYFEAWKLRKEKPETIKKVVSENVVDEDKMIVYYIAYSYFYNAEVKNRGYEKINIYITNKMLTLIQMMQDIVQNKIIHKGICIEVCPSSNVLLGNVKKGYSHPLINLFKRMKKDQKQSDICVSINTDDQGIFSTSLISEYSLLVNAFEHEMDNNEDMNSSRDFLYKWINKIRENSIRMCDLYYEEEQL